MAATTAPPTDPARTLGLAAWLALLRASTVLADRVGEDLEREAGLPLTWHEVLVRLDEAPEGRMRMLDLARGVLLSKSGVTRLVDRMVAAGLVRRVACPTDRRVTYAEITPRGRRALRRASRPLLRALEGRFWRHLSQQDLAQLRSALLAVLAANGHPEEECRSPAALAGGGDEGT
jgi:DNA-binding MarR family transcriptional regulator